MFSQEIIQRLKEGKIGIIPTDTLYGIVGSAPMQQTVERIYATRKRDLEKPMIILVADIDDTQKLGIVLSREERRILEGIWPNKASVVLPCPHQELHYLHRGTETLAVRIPNDEELRRLLRQTGPLVAPSANIQGEKPAESREEAEQIFRDKVDFYVDGGRKTSEPSTIISLRQGKVKVLRQGAFDVDSLMKC